MAIEVPGFRPGVLNAATDLSGASNQYKAVKLDGNGDFVLSGDGDLSIGILQERPVLGEAGEIEFDGISKARYGAAVTAGQELMSNASGQLIPAVGSTKRVVAVALTGGANGVLGSVAVVGLKGRALA